MLTLRPTQGCRYVGGRWWALFPAGLAIQHHMSYRYLDAECVANLECTCGFVGVLYTLPWEFNMSS